MAFWKKKKKIEQVEVREERVEEGTPYFGRVLVEIREKEKGEIANGKVNLAEEKRVLKVTNDSTFPVYNIKIRLRNNGNTDLPKEISIPSLGTAENERVYEREFKVKTYNPPIMLYADIEFSNKNQDFLYMEEENELYLNLKLKSNIEVKNGSIRIRYIPSETIRIKNYEQPTIGQVSTYGTELEWIINEISAGEETAIKIKLTAQPSAPEDVSLGNVQSEVVLSGKTFSGVEVEEAISRFLLQFGASKHELEDRPGNWEIMIYIENRHNRAVQAEGTIEILDGEIVEVKTEKLLKKQNALELREVIIDANARADLGPIIVSSEEIPKVRINIGGSVNEEVSLSSEGTYGLALSRIKIAGISLKKDAELIVDDKYKGSVGEGEIPTLGNNKIVVNLEIKNIGGVPIQEFDITEKIPEGLEDPENLRVFIGKTEAQATAEITGGAEGERVYKIKIMGEGGIKPDQIVRVTYELKPSRKAQEEDIYLTTKVEAKPKIEAKPIEKIIDETLAPKIRIRHVTRNVEVFKRVEPTEVKDEFQIIITVENKGEFPIVGYEIKQKIPSTFEIVEVRPEAQQKALKTATELRWTIDLEPYQQRELVIRIRGKEGYSIDDIMSIQTF